MELPDLCYKWRCDSCRGTHATECEAQECCAPSISMAYECPMCEDAHDSEDKALDCCDYRERNQPSPGEMEAQGQMRLTLIGAGNGGT